MRAANAGQCSLIVAWICQCTGSSYPAGRTRQPLRARRKLISEKVKFKRWGNKTASQARQTFALFGKSLNHDDLSCISQKDLSDFKDLLLGLSPTYGKSREDKDLTAAQLLAKGAVVPPGKRGVGVDATNRHLNFLGQLIKSIQAQGFAVDSALNPAALRTQESADPMDEVLPWTPEHRRLLYAQPPFTGCQDWNKRMVPGERIYHDGLY